MLRHAPAVGPTGSSTMARSMAPFARAEQIRRRGAYELDLDEGMLVAVTAQDRGHAGAHQVVRHTDAHFSGDGGLRHVVPDFVVQRQQAPAMRVQPRAGRGQAQRAPVAQEQRDVQRFLQPPDLLADGALRLREDVRGHRHAAVLGDSAEGADQGEVEVAVHGRISFANARHHDNALY